MSNQKSKTKSAPSQTDYTNFLDQIKTRIHESRIKAYRSVNRELIQLYWAIGKDIVSKQESLGWGKAVVEQLSKDLKRAFPGTTGFSERNLRYMQRFYFEYRIDINLQQLAAEIPWFSNVVILTKIKDPDARRFYLQATAEMGWSRNVLLHQIEMKAYERQALAPKQHNFKEALPAALAEQADQALKDTYIFDFLGITESAVEREVENRMVHAIKDVLLELGLGFAFLGNQYKIKANNKEYLIDLLFYHRHLQCLVAFELKTGSFKPEYAGKMNFYLNLLNDFVRVEHENPSIGIVLCTNRDQFEIEYALSGVKNPVGVAGYSLTDRLPQELLGKLPDVETLRSEVLRELGENKK